MTLQNPRGVGSARAREILPAVPLALAIAVFGTIYSAVARSRTSAPLFTGLAALSLCASRAPWRRSQSLSQ